jgi:arylsulfatase A
MNRFRRRLWINIASWSIPFAFLLVMAVVFGGSPCVASGPNIIILLADDLGFADLACYGNRFNETRNIDHLANCGMRFTQFYAGPVCSPTRCNLQSGLDQARFGITQHIPGHRRPFAKLIDPVVPLQLPSDTVTFAERLSEAGYRTGYFGKWHLGGTGFGPQEQGWQISEETKGNTIRGESARNPEGRTTQHLSNLATEFIRRAPNQPFLLQVSYNAVHIPLSTTSALRNKYGSKNTAEGYPSNPVYAGLLEELDISVGEIVKTVEDCGLSDQTIIIFLSDNGGLVHEQDGDIITSNAPLRGEKGTLYEGGIRIPSIWTWPGQIHANSVCETPATTIDIYATLMELTKTDFPMNSTDGVSLVQLFSNSKAKLARDELFWHLPHYHHSTPASAIRSGNWKLIEFYEDGALELYDLDSKPLEATNLAAIEVPTAQRLKESLDRWRNKVQARVPVPNPNYDPARASELAKGKERKE